MCPYCGEDVPDDSTSCWKCGTELSGDADEAEGDEGIVSPREPTARERQEAVCPHCGAVVSARALRCNECGRPFGAPRRARGWLPAVYVAFGVVVAAVVLGLGWAVWSRGGEAPDPGRDRPIRFDYATLARIYLDSPKASKLRELWRERHEGKFVEWEMVILDVADDGTLLLARSSSAAAPEVRLTLKRPEDRDALGLVPEKRIRFSAALRSYEGQSFLLDRGLILER